MVGRSGAKTKSIMAKSKLSKKRNENEGENETHRNEKRNDVERQMK
jgi:hypothetical protein